MPGVRDGGWAAAARADRTLQAVQVAILMVLAMIVVAVAVGTGRGMVSELRDYRDIQTTQSDLDLLKYTLQEQEAAFWRHRAGGGVGVPRDVLRNTIGAAGQADRLSRSPAVTEAVSAEVVGDTIARLHGLIAYVGTTPDPGPQGSAADRRFIEGLWRRVAGLMTSAGRWVEGNAATLEATNDRVTAATRRIVTLTGVTALLAALLGLVAWRLVSRSRRRVHAALEAATERLRHLADTDALTALGVAERVRAAVRDTPYPGGGGRLTASLGVASLTGGIDGDGLLERADTALYWAKRNGREDGISALRALARAIDARDSATQRHSIRVADTAVLIAGALGWTTEQSLRLREAGLVHDVGKIGIPDAVLLKPESLTPAERDLMKDHARLGARIVSEVLDDDQVEWVAHHHERWDGGGYPLGLAGPDIPEGARILAVADSWDAMTSRRNYSEAMTVGEALAECARCSGTQFWPAAVEALVRVDAAGALAAPETAELTEA